VIEASRIINKKVTWGLLALLVLYALCRSVAAAAGKSFWYDELLTLVVSSLGSWNARLTALRLPLDGQPPLFYAIEHFASSFAQNKEIALRLPSILAFPCTLTCVFIYVKRRSGETVGLLCALFLLMTSIFQLYAVEARPYSMVIACVALALVCYQRVPSPLWTVMLAVSLALAESLHYLSVLAMLPFGLAEAILFFKTRRIRWAVWVALVAGAVPLLFFENLLVLNKAYYGAHFWAQFQFSLIPSAYGELLLTNGPYGTGVAALVLAGILGTIVWPGTVQTADREQKSYDLAEGMLLFAFAALPFVGYVFASLTHSGLTPRYVLSTVIGVSIGLGYILSRATLRTVCLFGTFVLSAVGVHELHFWRSVRSQIDDVKSSGEAAGRFFDSAGHKKLPVLVPNGLALVWLSHYASPFPGNRFFYPISDQSQNHEVRADTVDKGIELLTAYLPFRTATYLEFTSTNKEFLVYEGQRDAGNWLSLRLTLDGWSLQTVEQDASRKISLVTRTACAACQIAEDSGTK
jgi:hypothetical protein